MKDWKKTQTGFYFLLHIGLLAVGQATAQTNAPGELRTERIKVPAVTQASYSAPEAPPVLEEIGREGNRSRRNATMPQQAGHYQPMPSDEVMMEQVGPNVEPYQVGSMAPPCAGNCGAPCGDACCAPCCPDPVCVLWQNLQVFGGVQGFKSPVDQGVNGNFGFHEGANWGLPVFEYGGIGGQIGAQVLQSDLAESATFPEHRTQFFFTTGLFHRPMNNHGWQGGVVFDWLNDDYYVRMNVTQIRGEISWISHGHHEIGFWTALATSTGQDVSHVNDGVVRWTPIDLYSLFYRKYFENGAVGRFNAGCTGEGEGLIGADFLAPISRQVALVAVANYVIGRDDPQPQEAISEGWGMTLSLVWFPGYKSACSSRNPYRPLFNVVDNSTMFLNFHGPEL